MIETKEELKELLNKKAKHREQRLSLENQLNDKREVLQELNDLQADDFDFDRVNDIKKTRNEYNEIKRMLDQHKKSIKSTSAHADQDQLHAEKATEKLVMKDLQDDKTIAEKADEVKKAFDALRASWISYKVTINDSLEKELKPYDKALHKAFGATYPAYRVDTLENRLTKVDRQGMLNELTENLYH